MSNVVINRLSELNALARRLQVARELSDELIMDVLQTCSFVELKKLPRLYQFVEYCEVGAWVQSSFWAVRNVLPTWTLVVRESDTVSIATLLSPHVPPFTIERQRERTELAVIETLVHTMAVLERVESSPKA